MKNVIIDNVVCLITGMLIMIIHELLKSFSYKIFRGKGSIIKSKRSILAVWRYIDPVGLILSVTCFVPVSKPYMFRIRDKKTNIILGITGFTSLLFMFALSIFVLKFQYGGINGIIIAQNGALFSKILVLFWQYAAMLSFGMLIANMFPISTFDMGLIIAGISSKHYLQIIKSDCLIKIILLLTLFLDIINYGCVRLMSFLII